MKSWQSMQYSKSRAKKHRVRFTRALLLCLCLAALLTFSLAFGSAAQGQDRAREVVVESGDTLWSLCRSHAPRGVDIRSYLHRVITENNLYSPTLYPGQVLRMP